MRKLIGLIIFAAIAYVAYTVLSDEEKRNKLFATIEDSTGLDIERDAKEFITESKDAVGEAAGELFNEFKDHLDDLELRQALRHWGKKALEKLNKAELRRLLDDLKEEIKRGTGQYDEIFEEYLST